MKNTPTTEPPDDPGSDLQPEYPFDYAAAKPNRFAADLPPGSKVIVLAPDVARVFTSPDEVNAVLRALIATMPKGA